MIVTVTTSLRGRGTGPGTFFRWLEAASLQKIYFRNCSAGWNTSTPARLCTHDRLSIYYMHIGTGTRGNHAKALRFERSEILRQNRRNPELERKARRKECKPTLHTWAQVLLVSPTVPQCWYHWKVCTKSGSSLRDLSTSRRLETTSTSTRTSLVKSSGRGHFLQSSMVAIKS